MKNFLSVFFHYLLVLSPYLIVLIVGSLLVNFLFNYFENKKEKIWDKKTQKLWEEANLKTDKELHKEIMLKESYINSVDRLGKFLMKIYKNKEQVFSLTPLDAMLLIDVLPFDIRKSKDGKYYLIDKDHFIFFLRLLVNKNHHYIDTDTLLKTREKLLKELMKWSKEKNIVVDVNFIFDLITDVTIKRKKVLK